jgi:serralysin
MYTSVEMAMLRQAAPPGILMPGIDLPTGAPTAPQIKASSITTSTGGPYFYDPVNNRVIVSQAGAVVSGIDFGNTTLTIEANNVTVVNDTFEPTTQYYSITTGATSGAVVENCTFTGPKTSSGMESFISSANAITIQNNSFINAPGDAIHINAGTITGNYFSGSGYGVGQHPDGIWVGMTTGPVTITGNFMDETQNSDAPAISNSCVRITTEQGNTSNVTITGNYMLGSNFPIEVSPGANGVFSNVVVTQNYVGFGVYGDFYSTNVAGATLTGNFVFDFTNTAYSTNAWAAYVPPTLRTLTSTGGSVTNDSTTLSTTVYGAGYSQIHLYGNKSFTNFVGGSARQGLTMGAGANIITELAIGDSAWITGTDYVNGFDPSKDVIDLSYIDADPATPGMQNFAYVGNSPLSGPCAEVHWYKDTVAGITYVEARLAGDTAVDLTIVLYGMPTLTAANFALTSAQSTAAVNAAISRPPAP